MDSNTVVVTSCANGKQLSYAKTPSGYKNPSGSNFVVSYYYSDGLTCGNSGEKYVYSVLGFDSQPPNTAATITGKAYGVNGGSACDCGFSQTCTWGTPADVTVTVKPSAQPGGSGGGGSSSACPNGDGSTYSMYPNGGSITETVCASGAVTTVRVYADAGDHLNYASKKPAGYDCAGYLIILKSAPTSPGTVDGFRKQHISPVDCSSADLNGLGEDKITVTIKAADCSWLPTGAANDYCSIGYSYATQQCDIQLAAQSGKLDECMTKQIGAFKTIYSSCAASTKADDHSQAFVTCMQDATGHVVDPQLAALVSKGQPNAPTCGGTVQGIGWWLCPLFTAIGGLDDAMFGFVAALLTTAPLAQTNPDGTVTLVYQVWSAFRSFANVALVIVFLIIIFSQLTSAGVSNYGVKKMLPRLVVAAILINISFPLMQLATDLANVLGSGIYNLMNGIIKDPTPPSWSGVLTTVLALGVGGTVAVAAIAIAPEAAVMLLLPGALAAVLGFLAAVLTLMFRQALIPLLAIVAPLAFVAYLLPNTKSWFDKWRSMFVAMLAMFPLAALLFSGTKMAGILINSGGQWWQTLTALIVMGAPLFMLPFLARQAGPLLGKLNGGLQGLGGKLQKPVGDWAGKRRSDAMAAAAVSSTRRNPGRAIYQRMLRGRQRRDVITAANKAQGAANFTRDLANSDTWAGGVKGADAQAYIRDAKAQADAKELKAAQAPLDEELAAVRAGTHPTHTNVDDFLEHRATDSRRSAAEREAAMHKVAALGRDGVVRRLKADASVDQNALERAVGANAGALAGKAPDLIKGPAAFESFTGKDLSQWSDGTAAAFMSHVEGLHAAGNVAGVNQALADFASATKDIQGNPNLQGDFNAKTGTKFQSEAGRMSAIPGLTGITKVFAGIGTDGKIR